MQIYKHHKNYDDRLRLEVFCLIAIFALLTSGIGQESSSSLEDDNLCNCVIFRLTGIQDYFLNEAQTVIMDLFLKNNQSITLGLIMNHIHEDQLVINKILEDRDRGLFELAINGLNFTDYSKLSEQAQANSLLSANEKMQTLFGISSEIFIPPFDSFNNSTLEAMYQTGMRILNSNIGTERDKILSITDQNGTKIANQTIYQMPITNSFGSYNITGDVQKVPINYLLNEIHLNIAKFGYAVINLDPQFFVTKKAGTQGYELNQQEIHDLSNLIDSLLANGIDITTFSKVIGIKTNIPVLEHKKTTLFSAPLSTTKDNNIMLTFDDGWKSHYTIAKPILDKYGFKSTFFIVCNYVGRDINGERMNWQDIEKLNEEGYDVQAHSMSHHNLSKGSKGILDFEIGQSKQCLLDHGINSTIFAYPFNEGSNNRTVVDTVAKYYQLARTGEEPLMFLRCDGWTAVYGQTDCRRTFDNGSLTFVNKYSIPGWTHMSHSFNYYNSSQMFQKFVEVINSQEKYNKNGRNAIPIIIYHNITEQNISEYNINTISIDKELFEAEIKYLHDNGFRVLTMTDLDYDEYTNRMYIKPLHFANYSTTPLLNDSSLKVELVVDGLQLPTTMAFLNSNDILILEKDKGTVKRILNGKLLSEPILDVNVATEVERCMCGIAVSINQTNPVKTTYVYLYFTEADTKDGGNAIGNRVYKYELVNGNLVNPQLILNLPAFPGPRHNGGAITIGPDNHLYVTIGDLSVHKTQSQNVNNGTFPNGSSGILRISQDGQLVPQNPLGNIYPLNLYYAYGIRNSFGMDFDPITGNLWDTENGPGYGDEINLVQPGFNSGWGKIQGLWNPKNKTLFTDFNNFVDFNGKGHYSSPEFIWNSTVAPTAIKFLHSNNLGEKYKNDLFIGDVTKGNIYHFDLNKNRTSLILNNPLTDRIANTDEELNEIIFGTGFGGITDIEVGPDGYLYVLSIGQGKLYRISPSSSEEGLANVE